MIKESRLTIRLIALWVIVIASLVLVGWSLQNMTTAVIKSVNGGYEVNTAQNTNMMGGGYYSPCIQPPMYPTLSSGQSYPGAEAPIEQSEEDKVALDKYNQDYEKYTNKLEVDCRADLEKQDRLSKNMEGSMQWSDIYTHTFSLLLGVILLVISLMVIKKSEQEA